MAGGYKIRKDKQELVISRAKEIYGDIGDEEMGQKLGPFSRGTYQNFKNRLNNLGKPLFIQVCTKLDLPWWEIADIPPAQYEEIVKNHGLTSGVNLLTSSNSAITIASNHPSETSITVTQKQTTALTVHSFSDIFDAFVADRTWHFAGRRKIFHKIEDFIRNNPCGYLTIVGLPGAGKSSILARYASCECKSIREESSYNVVCVAYFNNRNEGYSSVRGCLQGICERIIDELDLDIQLPAKYNSSEPLIKILSKASEKLGKTTKLVVVIDALDEIIQTAGANILFLPSSLPANIYFLLSRRYSSDTGVRLVVNTPQDSIDISSKDYSEDGSLSIRQYLVNLLNSEDPYYHGKLKAWIMNKINPMLSQHQRNKQYQAKENEFIETILEKSELNFMYVRYVARDFASGKYDDMEVRNLPQGLQQYYHCHWNLMDLDKEESIPYLRFSILYILIKSGCKVSCDVIRGRLLEIETYQLLNEFELDFGIYKIIQNWLQFLSCEFEIDEEVIPTYSVYHRSFNDFLVEKYKTIPQFFLKSLISTLAEY